MTREKVTIVTFVVHTTFSLLAALVAVYLLVKLSQKVHHHSTDKLSSNEFQRQKKLCAAACPGPMNCTEWSDCIFHQPDHCDKLQLLCFYEDNTLFSDVVLTYSGFNWYDIGRIVTLDLFMFLLVIGLFFMSIWCFQSIWINLRLTNMSMIAYHGSSTQAMCMSRRGIYAAVDRLKDKR